jgi:hypothetical protein
VRLPGRTVPDAERSLVYVSLGVLLIYALIAHGAASGRTVELLS